MAPHHALAAKGLDRQVDPPKTWAVGAREGNHRSHEFLSNVALLIVDNCQDDDATCHISVIAQEFGVAKEGDIGPRLVGFDITIKIGGVSGGAILIVSWDCHEFEREVVGGQLRTSTSLSSSTWPAGIFLRMPRSSATLSISPMGWEHFNKRLDRADHLAETRGFALYA